MDCKPQLRLVTSLAGRGSFELAASSGEFEISESTIAGQMKSEMPQLQKDLRRKRATETKEDVAKQASCLSGTVQNSLMAIYLSDGWGKAAHGLIRLLKSPKRSRLKIAEIALVMTVYDATVAEVNPKMFAPLSAEDFERETGVDRRDVFRTLSALVTKGILLKVKQGQVNFWGLNPHYLTLKDKTQNRVGKSPMGNFPMGNAPSDKVGNLPTGGDGENTHGETGLTLGNKKEKSPRKNLNQESLKESPLGELVVDQFPKDMQARWLGMEAKGQEHKAATEREIFLKLLPTHKQRFFETCGRVVTFLEEVGATKNGKVQKIHSPMIWIRDHWEHNLARYESWSAEQKTSQEGLVKEVNRKAEAAAQAERKRQAEQQAFREEEEYRAKWNAVADRFLCVYTDHTSCEAFVKEALTLAGSDYLSTYYTNYGWNNPVVRHTVLEHFSKVETGLVLTKVLPAKKGGQHE